MRYFDPKVRENIVPYLLQCCLATVAILLLLLSFNLVSQTAIIATLGATAFIVFALPRQYVSGPRPILGGYGIGIAIGALFRLISFSHQLLPITVNQKTAAIICGAIAVGITMLLMVVTDTEHPPAAGIALGLVLNTWDYLTIGFIFAAVGFMLVIKKVLQSKLVDLI